MEVGADVAEADRCGPDGPGGSPASPAGLRRAVGRALGWSMGGVLLGRVATLLTGVLLARILSPADYGVFAVALVALLLVANLNDLGLEQTLVRWPGEVDAVAPTAKTVILGSSIAQFGVMFLVAPAFASAMNAPEATGVVRLLSVGIVVNGLFAVPSAMLTRSFRQDLRTTADFIGFAVTTGVTIGLALAGNGVWSLAWGRIAGNAVNGILHAAFAPIRFPYGFSRRHAVEVLRQGLPIAGTAILAVAVLNVDALVVGRVLGATDLGYYVLAFNLASWPVSVFGVALWRVAVPAFARLQAHLDRLRHAFTRSLGLVMALTLPVCVMLAALALPLIRFVYGEKWEPAAPVLAALALLSAARIAMQLMTDLLVAVGRGRVSFRLQAVWLVVLVPALWVGARLNGIVGVGWAHGLTAALVVLPLYVRALRPLGIHARSLLRACGRPVLASAGGAAAAFLVARIVGPPELATLAAAAVAAGVVVAVVLAPMRHTALASVR